MGNPRLSALKPWICQADWAHRKNLVTFLKNGSAKVRMSATKMAVVPPRQQYDLTQATIFGLNERLTMSANSPIIGKDGKTLREQFNLEWEKYSDSLLKAEKGSFNYGVYAYYEEQNCLVRFCEPYWHHIVASASTSMLLTDPKGKMSWKEIRDRLSSATIAVAGCSVGGSVIHSTMMDLRPENIKIADKSLYKMENINRVRLGYWEIVESNAKRKTYGDSLLKNKALVTASQIYAIDPYVNVYCYDQGVNESNIEEFISGSKTEPAADFLIEEVDDPRIKILLRQAAKKFRIPLLMVTDIGSSIQLDILRFDQNPKLTLTFGNSDKNLIKSMLAVYDNPGDRKIFFNFVDQLIGKDYRQGELKKIIDQKTEIPTSTIIPQMGSTIAAAGGILAEAIARIRLGHDYPARIIFNKQTFKTRIYG